jgi:hypothetical protein
MIEDQLKKALKEAVELTIAEHIWKDDRQLRHFINNIIQANIAHIEIAPRGLNVDITTINILSLRIDDLERLVENNKINIDNIMVTLKSTYDELKRIGKEHDKIVKHFHNNGIFF